LDCATEKGLQRDPLVDVFRDSALRRRAHGNYLIFFDIGTAVVEILHILHGARDYAQIVFPDDPTDVGARPRS
jgi:plasmid stabilization system protein ParE